MKRPSITNFPVPAIVALLIAACTLVLQAQEASFLAPDKLVLKDGTVIRGMILRNSVDAVLMQKEFHEQSFPKSEIVRIIDHPDDDAYFTEAFRKGDLPPWRAIANDLRTNDRIRSVVEIPATLIDNGVFKNVPYKSFLVNRDIELNIYGDPANPAGVELGIYGRNRGNARLQKMLRGYLAGFLTTREELAKLYALDLRGGSAKAGEITLEITPPDAPDAYGAWWVSIYIERELDRVRLTDAEYAKITRPQSEAVNDRRLLRSLLWSSDEARRSKRAKQAGDSAAVLLRGFYRAPDGVFRLVNTHSGD